MRKNDILDQIHKEKESIWVQYSSIEDEKLRMHYLGALNAFIYMQKLMKFKGTIEDWHAEHGNQNGQP